MGSRSISYSKYVIGDPTLYKIIISSYVSLAGQATASVLAAFNVFRPTAHNAVMSKDLRPATLLISHLKTTSMPKVPSRGQRRVYVLKLQR